MSGRAGNKKSSIKKKRKMRPSAPPSTSSKVKKHVCTYAACTRSFTSVGNLSRHLKSHTGEKPFTCKVCQKKFGRAFTLSRHMITHTKETPYHCDFPSCSKQFNTSGNLSRHKRIHTKTDGVSTFEATERTRIRTRIEVPSDAYQLNVDPLKKRKIVNAVSSHPQHPVDNLSNNDFCGYESQPYPHNTDMTLKNENRRNVDMTSCESLPNISYKSMDDASSYSSNSNTAKSHKSILDILQSKRIDSSTFSDTYSLNSSQQSTFVNKKQSFNNGTERQNENIGNFNNISYNNPSNSFLSVQPNDLFRKTPYYQNNDCSYTNRLSIESITNMDNISVIHSDRSNEQDEVVQYSYPYISENNPQVKQIAHQSQEYHFERNFSLNVNDSKTSTSNAVNSENNISNYENVNVVSNLNSVREVGSQHVNSIPIECSSTTGIPSKCSLPMILNDTNDSFNNSSISGIEHPNRFSTDTSQANTCDIAKSVCNAFIQIEYALKNNLSPYTCSYYTTNASTLVAKLLDSLEVKLGDAENDFDNNSISSDPDDESDIASRNVKENNRNVETCLQFMKCVEREKIVAEELVDCSTALWNLMNSLVSGNENGIRALSQTDKSTLLDQSTKVTQCAFRCKHAANEAQSLRNQVCHLSKKQHSQYAESVYTSNSVLDKNNYSGSKVITSPNDVGQNLYMISDKCVSTIPNGDRSNVLLSN